MAAFNDLPAVVATQDNQQLPLALNAGDLLWGQIYASPNNIGTVWLGGSSVAANRGIPLIKQSTFFIPPIPGTAIRSASIFLFFEKNGDKVYGLVVT